MTNIQSGYLKTKNGVQLMTTVPYPIGAIYLSIDSTNPSKLFGGTWQQIAKGRTLVGVDTSQTEFNIVKKTGGEKTHTLTINEMPSHNHTGSTSTNGSHNHKVLLNEDANFPLRGWPGWNGAHQGNAMNLQSSYTAYEIYAGANGNHNHTFTTDKTGNGKAHNNLQPYYTCYIWLRTA